VVEFVLDDDDVAVDWMAAARKDVACSENAEGVANRVGAAGANAAAAGIEKLGAWWAPKIDSSAASSAESMLVFTLTLSHAAYVIAAEWWGYGVMSVVEGTAVAFLSISLLTS
jgi:hypothetical protein